MNLTIGFVLLFLNIFLPGLLFLRFYYKGDFSKQFSTRIPIFRLAFYSFLPGIFLQFGCIFIYSLYDAKFTVLNSLEIFTDLLSGLGNFKPNTVHFFKTKVYTYSIYTILVCLLSTCSALFLHWFVRYFDLDIKFKILRFRNQWHYLFNGDILRFKKYKIVQANLSTTVSISDANKNVMLAYADILVSQSSGTKLYTGFVMDYDLDPADSNDLEKIYLMGTKKHEYQEGESKIIDLLGHVFVIQNSKIENINITYIPSVEKLNENNEKEKVELENIMISIVALICILVLFFVWIKWMNLQENRFFIFYISEFNLVQKFIIIIATLNTFIYLTYRFFLGVDEKPDKIYLWGMLGLNVICLLTIIYEIYF